jgi:ubiquinone/menaquinone biosynthesis C-methylase UbiE
LEKAWSSGDYGKVGVRLLLMGELLCEVVDVHPGQKVLDVACGNGKSSILCGAIPRECSSCTEVRTGQCVATGGG